MVSTKPFFTGEIRLHPLAKFLATLFPSLYAFALRFRPGYNEETRCYLRLIRKGDAVFDIGANYGHYTVLYSHLTGPSGHVYGFEPVPRSSRELHRRIEKETVYDNVILNEFAVTDLSDLELTIAIPNGDYGQASLASHTHGSWGLGGDIQRVTCRTITLDDYVHKNSIRKVDFIKIDVEGAELPVLRGAARLLKLHRPIIHLEYFNEWSKAFNYTLADLVSFLETCGYDNFYLDDLIKIEDFHAHFSDFNTSTNLVCACGPLQPRMA